MRKMIRAVTGVCLAAILFQCSDHDLVSPNQQVQPLELTSASGKSYLVHPSGNDATGDGSVSRPWRTLRHAASRVTPYQGHTIQLAAGTYVESGQINIPAGVHLNGAGRDVTFVKAASSFYYNPSNPGYGLDRYLITLKSSGQENGNQNVTNITIDGDGKKLHGGIYVFKRNNVTIQNVNVQNTNFNGIWLWDVNDSKMITVKLLNCSWGSNGWSAGALHLGGLNRVDISKLDINESTGYGIKAIGPDGNNPISNTKIHDSRISVHPVGLWNSGSAPNIAIEFILTKFSATEIYNNYVDNTISLVNTNLSPTGTPGIRIHHNTLDMETRAKGAGYGIELSMHDAEIDHNYFLKGTNGIANWDAAVRNWSIHHNVFYGLAGTYPGEVVRSQKSGLHNVKLYNNTIEFAGTKTMNVIGLYGGASDNIDVRNNLVINSNSSYSYYQNKFLHLENGATNTSMTIRNNHINNVNTSNISLTTLLSCVLNAVVPSGLVSKTGNKPDPYYVPGSNSALIDRGVNVGFPFNGSAPDIGAFEAGGSNVGSTSSRIVLNFDSSQAELHGKMVAGNDSQAGSFFHIPSGNGVNWYLPASSTAKYWYQAPKAGTYYVWARVKAPTGKGFHVYDGRGRWITWPVDTQSQWRWVKVTNSGSPATFTLAQGTNELQFAFYQDDTKLDRILITDDANYVPN